jgi:hypothetical protein
MYSFAYNDRGSDELWNSFEYVILNTINILNERSLTLVIWSFSKRNIESDSIWI